MALRRITGTLAVFAVVFFYSAKVNAEIYSIGNFMYQNLTSLDNKCTPNTTPGAYFLPYEVPYNGTLVEIEVCGFISESFDLNSGRNVRVQIVIYRRGNIENMYNARNIIFINITPEYGNMYGCKKENLKQMNHSVLVGDRIAVLILNDNSCCPNLVSLNCSLTLLYLRHESNVDLRNVVINNAEPRCQFLNMNITIDANDSEVEPTTCLDDSLPIATTCTVSISENEPQPTPTLPPNETTRPENTTSSSRSASTSWIAIFGAAVGSVVVIILSLTPLAIVCILFTRRRKTPHGSSILNKSITRSIEQPVGFTNVVYSNNSEYEAFDDSGDQFTQVSVTTTATKNSTNREDSELTVMLNGAQNRSRVYSVPNDYCVPYSSATESFPAAGDGHYEFDACSDAYDGADVKKDEVEYDYDQMMQSGEVKDTLDYENEEEYFIPATREDELKEQLQRLKIRVILNTDLHVRQQIGSGQFGTVCFGVWHHSDSTNDDEEVAVKSMQSIANEEERVKFLQEATIMGQFNHPNVLSILGIVLEDPLQIVMDIMDKGDLHHHLQILRPTPGEPVSSTLSPTLLSYSRQIAFGLMYLDVKKFVHRDLAARNILVASSGVCKIADFGMSRDLQDENYYVAHGGMIPVKWTAPEALMYRKYSSASDIWSYGCLLYEIWSLGYKPFHDVTNAEAIKKVENGHRLPPPPGCPRAIYHIMIKCWHPDASSRPNPSNVVMGLSHPDFQILNWSTKDSHNNSEEARTLGTSIEAGHSLFPDLQKTYYP